MVTGFSLDNKCWIYGSVMDAVAATISLYNRGSAVIRLAKFAVALAKGVVSLRSP